MLYGRSRQTIAIGEWRCSWTQQRYVRLPSLAWTRRTRDLPPSSVNSGWGEWTIEFEYHLFEVCNLVPGRTLDRSNCITGRCQNCCANSMIGVIHILHNALFTIFDPPAKRDTWPTPRPLLCNCPAEPLPRGSLEYDFWIKFCCGIFFLHYNWHNLWPFISQSIALFQRPKQIINVCL